MTPLILTGGGKKFTWQWACGKDSVVLIAILIHLMALDEKSSALFIQFHLDVHRLVIHLEVNLKQGQEKVRSTVLLRLKGLLPSGIFQLRENSYWIRLKVATTCVFVSFRPNPICF